MRKSNAKLALFLTALLFLWFFPKHSSAIELREKVTEFTLPNGMKFLIAERHISPVFIGFIMFKTGSVDEVTGTTGVAHLLEHMASKGTPAIGTRNAEEEKKLLDEIEKVGSALSVAYAKGEEENKDIIAELKKELATLQDKARALTVPAEMDAVYEEHGAGDFNAFTANDLTAYFVALPVSRLELWMLMESERIKNLVLREFYEERDVVMEECRLAENDPDDVQYDLLLSTAFSAHPYRTPILGYISDLKTITTKDTEKFFRRHYVPQNAVAAIVGDVDPAAVVELAMKYFGDIPRGEEVPLISTVEPPQRGERRATLEWDAEPSVSIAYHIPAYPHADYYSLQALDYILSSGNTSRLYKALVEKGYATDAWAYTSPGERYPHLFIIEAEPIAARDTAKIEKIIYAEIERLKREPPTERELEKMRNNLEASFIRGLGSNFSLAFQLSEFELLTGSWKNVVSYLENIQKVKGEDISEVAKRYFEPSNRTVVTRMKKNEK